VKKRYAATWEKWKDPAIAGGFTVLGLIIRKLIEYLTPI
jgi:hypothetical protein